MKLHDDHLVEVDQSDLNRGRIDRTRLGRANADDTEPRPVVTEADRQATRDEMAKLKQRRALEAG